MKNKWPPAGSNIRRLYERAEYSSLQPYRSSNVERYTWEIQSVKVNKDIVPLLPVVRAYKDREHIEAFADGNVGRTREIIGVWAVPSTKLSDVSHAITQAAKERTLEPAVITTDTIPRGIDFWESTFGKQLKCRLGLFHHIHRIVDTLDSKCELYWPCLVEITDAIYKYNDGDWSKLVKALNDGTLDREGKKHHEDEIVEMRLSKIKYRRKDFHTVSCNKVKLTEWIGDWEHKEDNSGRKVFSYKTANATRDQFTFCKPWL